MGAKITDIANNRVYAAERILGLYEVDIVDLKQAQKLVDRVVKTKRFQKAFPFYGTRPVTVRAGQGGGSYAWSHDPNSGGPSIRMSPVQMDTATLWHELAHHLVFRHPDRYVVNERGHGALFAAMQFQLVRITMGPEAQQALRYSYRTWRVRMWDSTKKRKRLMSAPKNVPENWIRFSKEAAFAVHDKREQNRIDHYAYCDLVDELETAGVVSKDQYRKLTQLRWKQIWTPRQPERVS
jgi:putative metallohydrolase (TIGR04338 family)